ncbi:DUF294 nucleotidyltransferase-like domain-containing protein [Cerasicoccus arenae]|uniref:CBS domain-containing protein n=1 Tax=Cerasicoccus arenae TaxID=424488 RepID=A0A8J3DIX1_9BACT|nr:DUF294 nucleotidyltransferase-like domain-containing protein [Cerasicoccus arenae]MBK1858673.1 CBS domain-containing protein [Cerasicoccus arenae]GHB98240.1 hypothetical protein GCM10007047_12840 [Cerasicoccus arenae]
MKTSSISLRVADFLKGHPPFDMIAVDDLLRLAGTGRVKFHEGGEIVYTEGEERGRYAFVIQKGTVNLFRRSVRGEDLIDVRVEGDLLGFLFDSPDTPYRCTVKTAGDTIIYAIPQNLLREVGEKYEEVGDYFREYFGEGFKPRRNTSSTPDNARGIDERPAHWLQKSGPVNERASNRLLTFRLDEPIHIVAKRLAPGLQEAIVAVDNQMRPLGIITESDLSARVATGAVPVDAAASAITTTSLITVRPGMSAGQLILEMLHHRLHHLIVTEDGTTNTPVVGIISDRSIQMLHGSIPTFLAKEISVAENAHSLAILRDRADELLLHYIEGDAQVYWLADFIAEVDGAVLEQAVRLSRKKLLAEGMIEPKAKWCWLAMHSEGRKERLLRSPQRSAMVYDELPAGAEGDDAEIWFARLATEITAMLAPCGFSLDPNGRMATNPQWRGTLSVWKERYHQWIAYPVENNILALTPYFDARCVYGDSSLLDELRTHIQACIHDNPNFMPLLANDALDNLPPITIFRDSVMDQSGTLWSSIDTKLHALLPLVDTARVFALKLNLEDSTFTPLRFKRVGRHLIEHRELFEEAAEAFSHAIRLQTRMGLRRGDDGQYVKPDELPRGEVQRCKAIFKTVVRLMEFATEYFHLEGKTLS